MTQVPAVLLLEDGTAFYGKSAGKIGTTTGELCFNTGMTGYQEVFTDPSYFGQLLVTTNAHIGNYGTRASETESGNIKIAGLVCKNYTWQYSRLLATESIQDYFQQEALIGISDVDTRAIVRHIRHKGAMNAIISSDTLDLQVLKAQLAEVPSMDGLELASKVSTESPYFMGNSDAKYKVAVLDYGVKGNILNCMVERGLFFAGFSCKNAIGRNQEVEPRRVLPLQRSRRPRPYALCRRDHKRDFGSGEATVWYLSWPPNTGFGDWHFYLQDAQWPPGHQPSGKKPNDWPLRNHQPKPRIRRPCRPTDEPGGHRNNARQPERRYH